MLLYSQAQDMFYELRNVSLGCMLSKETECLFLLFFKLFLTIHCKHFSLVYHVTMTKAFECTQVSVCIHHTYTHTLQACACVNVRELRW